MTRTYFMVGDLDVEQVRKSVLRAVVDQSSDHEKDTVQLVKREEVSETDSNASVPEIMKDNFITQMKNLFHPTFHVCRM